MSLLVGKDVVAAAVATEPMFEEDEAAAVAVAVAVEVAVEVAAVEQESCAPAAVSPRFSLFQTTHSRQDCRMILDARSLRSETAPG